jgi:hypothetical protein
MWRGTRSFYCTLPKEPYLEQRRGALWRLVPFLFTSVHPSTRQSYCRKLDFRFTAFSEVRNAKLRLCNSKDTPYEGCANHWDPLM